MLYKSNHVYPGLCQHLSQKLCHRVSGKSPAAPAFQSFICSWCSDTLAFHVPRNPQDRSIVVEHIHLVGGLVAISIFPYIGLRLSSQLTFIFFFRGVAQPPTSHDYPTYYPAYYPVWFLSYTMIPTLSMMVSHIIHETIPYYYSIISCIIISYE